ncbi:MAG: CBS domain-containing protein [Candidatus Eremiobacteraeota bacterium]|nr:CBS domain-containing protein [Candidatus Eremiobacteraeota bacterium]
MGKSYQVRCPQDGKQHVVEVNNEGQVCWCSREMSKPACNQGCLQQFRSVAFLMHTDVPTFEESELECLTYDQVVQRFESLPFERLPVLSEGKPVGTLALRDVALWKDNREFQLLLSQKEWDVTADHLRAEQCIHDEDCFLKLSDPWEKAVQHLLAIHENEAVVVDDDGLFAGMVYARQLLRAATVK